MEAIIIALIAGVPSSISAISSLLTNKKVKKIDDLKYDADKTYLTDFISDVENGITKSDIQKQMAHEKYDEYVKFGGNSYVHEHWDNLRNKELI